MATVKGGRDRRFLEFALRVDLVRLPRRGLTSYLCPVLPRRLERGYYQETLLTVATAPLSPKRGPLAITFFLVSGLLLTLSVPYLVPMAPAVSESYIYGFNNRVAEAIFLLFVAAFAWWIGTRPLRLETAPAPPLPWPALGIMFCLPIFLLGVIWRLARVTGGVHEGLYFLNRLQEVSQGGAVYRDFEFAYGPIMLYLPMIVARVTRVSLTDAFYITWIAQWLLGLILLWRTVEYVCRDSARKNVILAILVFTWLPSVLDVGPNYTPLRFWAVPYAATVIYRRIAAGRPLLATAGIGVGYCLLILLYSPEQSISFVGATLLMFLLFVFPRRVEVWIALGVFMVGTAGIFAFAAHKGLFETLRSMGTGGYNFPLLPAPHLFPIFALLLIAGWVFVDGLRHPREAGVAHYLIATTLFTIPAAFGRCDRGHIIINTVGAAVVGLTILANNRVVWRWTLITYVATVLLLPLPFTYLSARQILNAALRAGCSQKRLISEPSCSVRLRLPTPNGEPLRAPVGFSVPLPEADARNYVTSGRFDGLQDVLQPHQLEQKLRELREHPRQWLILPRNYRCDVPPPSREALFVDLAAMYFPRPRHEILFFKPLCNYIEAAYEPAETPSEIPVEYELLRPRMNRESSSLEQTSSQAPPVCPVLGNRPKGCHQLSPPLRACPFAFPCI